MTGTTGTTMTGTTGTTMTGTTGTTMTGTTGTTTDSPSTQRGLSDPSHTRKGRAYDVDRMHGPFTRSAVRLPATPWRQRSSERTTVRA
ncbi:hypothetical protein CH253_16645 [Rhodococcus sp. 06-156-3C]|nr:hypothetical protein CH253_16645 [Rhodococcus sp. 06-156-3C]OZD21797.1 hypothetical protein CH280_02560 [Rhodococcus sp. 06-156-4C]OZD25484.1 hypothetical protein CH248_05430 [Rhodococcus sp. 06-156-4a]OZD32903.1 hypothetical protein CH247_09430 [Rhodococcus sp. 06-156-3b]OZD42024.1 hypothetical protein CH284_01250 [Rhodococcus sp. 06-156-3]OZF60391.1 hypothetical protein CH290_18675 [Rhodococcus sp. 06-156-4]